MIKFFKKNGSIIIFVIVLIICLSFFLQIITMASTYKEGINNQALEHAEYYANEQELILEKQINKITAYSNALSSEVRSLSSLGDAISVLSRAKTDLSSAESDKFKDIFYTKDGKVFSTEGNESTYSAMTEVAQNEYTCLTKAFQYEESLMSIGVYSPTNSNGAVDGVIIVFWYDILWEEIGDAECMSKEVLDISLLCKNDGTPLQDAKKCNDDTYTKNENYQITGNVLEGILFALVTDEQGYATLKNCILTGVDGSAITTVGTNDCAVVIKSLGAQNGGLFLFNIYKLKNVYGSGYEMVGQIMGVMFGLAVIAMMFCLFVLLNRRKTNKLMYNIEMVNKTLNCATESRFFIAVPEYLKKFKMSNFVLVTMRITNYSYMIEHLGDEATKDFLVHERNVLQNSMTVGETYAYHTDGEFYLLLNFSTRKELTSRLNAIYRLIDKYEFTDEDYKTSLDFYVYEIKDHEELPQKMLDKLKIVQRTAAQQNGLYSITYYTDIHSEGYFKRAEIEGRMELALENSEFHLFYQPKFNLRKNTMDGSEILVRWFDPKINAYRQPGEFLPVFEENGFVDKLDRFVFFRACENIAQRVAEGKQVFPASVNVSRVTATRPDFVEYYKRIKAKFNVPDQFLTLEFTESFAYENYEYLSQIISELHSSGFLCSLDDFGTGYSSYNVLKTLDMDEIKLDKFFLSKGTSKERDQMLLSSTIDIVKKIGIKVTQEGVETKSDYDMLIDMGCDVIQGYYFSRPMKYSDYRKFVEENFSTR